MNHAGSASSFSVCETTNQEKFDLTQAGKFPSIIRGKCWSSRERHRLVTARGERVGGVGGPAWALPVSRVGGRHTQALGTSGSVATLIRWPLSRHSPTSLGLFWVLQVTWISDPSHLALPAPPYGTPESFQASLFFTSVFAHVVLAASNNILPFQNLTHGHAHGDVSQTPQAELTVPSRVPSLS